MAGGSSVSPMSDLKVGDWVAVRSPSEILATLDANGRFEELPFKPQMLHKLCDTAFGTGGRRLTDAVFLDDLRCDGEVYGGCEMRCTVVWKEAWLRRADADEPESHHPPSERLEALVRAGTRRPSKPESN
jgi:hypothetical protein